MSVIDFVPIDGNGQYLLTYTSGEFPLNIALNILKRASLNEKRGFCTVCAVNL